MRVDTVVLNRLRICAPRAAALALAALTLAGCGTFGSRAGPAAPATPPSAGAQTVTTTKLQKFFWVFSPYRPDIQQGNFVSKEMLAQVQVGQTRDQIKFILGTPLLTDVFHQDRWDYPFYMARGNGELTSAKVVIFFKDDKVERFEGGNLPSEQEYIARIAGPAKLKREKDVPKQEEVGAASIKINK
ncbi:outer membrane protein assembly factor BamE [Massilia sp. TSP1-1-2]|uniref:outer membrane protein assembly factor BamE n=1 Tax=unclassified Massilia TaxID=2609279 RepID=UPI003CF84FA9